MAKATSHAEADMNKVIPKGEKGYTFPPGALNIIWGKDQRYWNIKDNVAELVQVCWLEVTGSTKDPKSNPEGGPANDIKLEPGTYEVSFMVSLKEGAFGWANYPVRVVAKPGKKGKQIWQKIDVTSLDSYKEKLSVRIEENAEDKNIYFGLYEVWSGRWKGGLVIHGVEIQKVK